MTLRWREISIYGPGHISPTLRLEIAAPGWFPLGTVTEIVGGWRWDTQRAGGGMCRGERAQEDAKAALLSALRAEGVDLGDDAPPPVVPVRWEIKKTKRGGTEHRRRPLGLVLSGGAVAPWFLHSASGELLAQYPCDLTRTEAYARAEAEYPLTPEEIAAEWRRLRLEAASNLPNILHRLETATATADLDTHRRELADALARVREYSRILGDAP